MHNSLFFSIDIGTSSCKTVLMDETGAALGSASREYDTCFEDGDAVSQNAADWWESVCETIRVLTKILPEGAARRIAGIGIDGQSSVMLPVDRDGAPLFQALIWTDHRSRKQAERIDREIGQETLTAINGNKNDASNVAPKIMWFRDTYPGLYKRTYRILSSVGYIVYRLTGKFTHNLSEGGLTQLFDIGRGEWSDELIGGCGLRRDLFPELSPCYAVVGGISAEASAELGLPSGIPVIAGAMDVCACALGTGAVSVNDAFITGGTVTAVGVCTDRPIRNRSLHVYHHIMPGVWCNVAAVDFGGGSFRWFRDRFMAGYTGTNAYDEMNRLAAQSAPGAGGLLFLPSLVGQRCPQWDTEMRGAFVGITARSGKEDFLRAVMEGNAYGVREIVELQEREGARLEKILIAGGISRSDLWLQIFADVLRRRILRVRCREDTAFGNLIAAGYGVGLFDSFEVPLTGREFEPIPGSDAVPPAYERMYACYQGLYPALKDTFHTLTGIASEQ